MQVSIKEKDAAPGLAAFVVASKQRVLAIEDKRAEWIFHVVAVDLDAAVGQESIQSGPVAEDVGQFLAEA